MSKHILSYDKFLNETASGSGTYRSTTFDRSVSVASSPGNFVKEAVKALTDGGMNVEVLSSDRQLKNDNLFCKISFPKIVNFIKEYYDFDYNTQVAYIEGNNLKQEVNNFSIDNIVLYSKGYMMRTSGQNTEFEYSSIERMVQETKVFLAKAFIYSSGSKGQILFPKRNKKILVGDGSEKSFSKSVQSKHSRNLPDSVKKIFDQIDEFSKSYNLLYSFDEDNCKLITLMLCSLAEMELLKPGFEIGKIKATLFTLKSSNRSTDKRKFYRFDYSLTKNLFTRKDTFRILRATTLDEIIIPEESWWSMENTDWFLDYKNAYLKLQAMSQEELDSYFTDLAIRKRGVIHSKKFNL